MLIPMFCCSPCAWMTIPLSYVNLQSIQYHIYIQNVNKDILVVFLSSDRNILFLCEQSLIDNVMVPTVGLI